MVDSQKMRLSKAAAVILLIVLLAGAGGAYWAYRQGRLYFSDPAMPRKNPTYEEVFVSPKGVEASPNNEVVFGKTTIETNGAQIRVMMSGNSNIPKAELPFMLHRANASEAVQIENGTIRLSYLITGRATPSNSREEWGRVSGTIYGPDL